MATGTINDMRIRVMQPGVALKPSNCVNAVSLAASTAESITVPTGATTVMFKSTGDFYANFTTTATIPGDTTNGTASELNPYICDIEGMTISVIAPAACVVTAAFWK